MITSPNSCSHGW